MYKKILLIFIFIFNINIFAIEKLHKKSNLNYMIGTASYYGDPKINHYPLMANGKKFDPNNSKIAAHPTLKLGTKLKVINVRNKREICVIVTDRMPKKNRVIDLSYAGAKKLKMIKKGLTKVKLTIINNKDFYSRRCNETH